jgi:non-ribosomal peptide synthetase component F
VPLDARHPDARLRGSVATTWEVAFPRGPRLVVARPEEAARLGDLAGAMVIDVDRMDPRAAEPTPASSLAAPPVDPMPEAAAYLIFTSGSTGEPNPVAVSYGALAAHLSAVRRAYGLGPGERVIQVQSLAFDASVEQILGAMTSGACLFPAAGGALGLTELLDFIRRHRLTVVNLPTALWSELAREVVGRRGVELPDLRLLLAGGEAMPPAAARRWLAGLPALPGATRPRLINAYGPTEAVVTATLGPVDGEGDLPGELEGAGGVPVGRPLAGRRAVVLDAAGRPAPLGAVGELCLGGVVRFSVFVLSCEHGSSLHRPAIPAKYRRYLSSLLGTLVGTLSPWSFAPDGNEREGTCQDY